MDNNMGSTQKGKGPERPQRDKNVVQTGFFSSWKKVDASENKEDEIVDQKVIEDSILDSNDKAGTESSVEVRKSVVCEEKILDSFKSLKYIITQDQLTYMEDWRRAYKAFLKNDFFVAVVGEFSTGKSTLLNKLLDTEVLPVGNLPTTAMLTRISYGESNSLLQVLPDGRKNELEFCENSFDKLIADPNGEDPDGVLEVRMNHRRLKKSGVYLFDTPGAGDIFGKRINVVVNVLTQCDGAIFTVSADKLLSASEKAFMYQYIISQKTPHICVVLTKLNIIDSDKQANIVKYVANHVKKISPDIEFVVSSERSTLSDGIDAAVKCGKDVLWEIIESWAVCKENANLRGIRAYAQINELITKIEKEYLVKLKITELDEEKRSEILKELNIKLAELKLIWTDIENEIDKCRISYKNWIYDTLDTYKEDMITRFSIEINKISDPKMWYENDFPYRVRVDVNNMSKAIEGSLQKRFYTDINKISEFIKCKFQSSLMLSNTVNDQLYRVDSSIFDNPTQQKLASLNKLRWAMRVGTGVATFGSYLIFTGLGPVGILAGTAGALISEKVLSGKIEKQRIQIFEAVKQTIGRVFSEALSEIDSKTQKMYRDVGEEIYNAEIAWLKEQQRLMEQKGRENTPVEDSTKIKHKLDVIAKMKTFINS